MPASERPRERLAAHGPGVLSHAELIAILLRTGTKGVSALAIAQQLLVKFGTLQTLAGASLDELRAIKGIGRDKAVTLQAAFTLAVRMARELHSESPVLENPDRIADLLREEFRTSAVETFHIVLLNTRRKLIRVEKFRKARSTRCW